MARHPGSMFSTQLFFIVAFAFLSIILECLASNSTGDSLIHAQRILPTKTLAVHESITANPPSDVTTFEEIPQMDISNKHLESSTINPLKGDELLTSDTNLYPSPSFTLESRIPEFGTDSLNKTTSSIDISSTNIGETSSPNTLQIFIGTIRAISHIEGTTILDQTPTGTTITIPGVESITEEIHFSSSVNSIVPTPTFKTSENIDNTLARSEIITSGFVKSTISSVIQRSPDQNSESGHTDNSYTIEVTMLQSQISMLPSLQSTTSPGPELHPSSTLQTIQVSSSELWPSHGLMLTTAPLQTSELVQSSTLALPTEVQPTLSSSIKSDSSDTIIKPTSSEKSVLKSSDFSTRMLLNKTAEAYSSLKSWMQSETSGNISPSTVIPIVSPSSIRIQTIDVQKSTPSTTITTKYRTTTPKPSKKQKMVTMASDRPTMASSKDITSTKNGSLPFTPKPSKIEKDVTPPTKTQPKVKNDKKENSPKKPGKVVTEPSVPLATDGIFWPPRTYRVWTVNALFTTPTPVEEPKFHLLTTPGYIGRLIPDVFITFELRMSWTEFCSALENFQKILQENIDRAFDPHEHYRIKLMLTDECTSTHNIWKRFAETLVNIYIVDSKGQYDRRMTSKFASTITTDIFDDQPGDFKGKVIRVYVAGSEGDEGSSISTTTHHLGVGGGTIAGIVVASLIFIILVCFIAFQVVIFLQRRSVKKTRQIMYDDGSRPSVELHSIEESIHMVNVSSLSLHGFSYINQALDLSDHKDYTSNPMTLYEALEYIKDPDSEDFEDEFLMLPNTMPKIVGSFEGGELKNRYANVIPLEQTRVYLETDSENQYINANYVRGYDGIERTYIATQAPMDNTTADFWSMVWQQQSQVILMLTGLEENGQAKCAEYWPNTDGCDIVRIYGDFNVHLQHREVCDHWIWSDLLLKNMETSTSREVHHVWLTSWPKAGVPSDPNIVIDILLQTRPLMDLSLGPIVVHCSPGTGRTGTVLAIDIGMRSLDADERIDVLKTAQLLREDRAGSVQTKDQYYFIYKTLVEYALRKTIIKTPSMSSISSGSCHSRDEISGIFVMNASCEDMCDEE